MLPDSAELLRYGSVAHWVRSVSSVSSLIRSADPLVFGVFWQVGTLNCFLCFFVFVWDPRIGLQVEISDE